MPIVIDGWNFIRNERSLIKDEDDDSLIAAKRLIEHLIDFQAGHGDPIILVFDSANEYLGIEYRDTAKLTVVPARDADEYIKNYIDKTAQRQRRNLRVVSSDNSVYYYAKSAYAAPVRSEEFWDKMKRHKARFKGEVDKGRALLIE